MPTDITIVDLNGVNAKIVVMQGIESQILVYLNQAQQAAEEAAQLRDHYPLRGYFTPDNVYGIDQLAFNGDEISKSASGTASWDTSDEGALHVPVAETTGTAQYVLDLGAGATLENALGLAMRALIAPDLKEFTPTGTAALTNNAGTILWSGGFSLDGVRGYTEMGWTLEGIPKADVAADRLQIDIAWQLASATPGHIDFDIADTIFFDDHSDQLLSQHVVLTRRSVVSRNTSKTLIPGYPGSGDVGRTFIVNPSSGTVSFTLDDDAAWEDGDTIDFINHVTGAAQMGFLAGGAAVIIANGTTTGLTNTGERVMVTYWLDGATHTWFVTLHAS